ncbi:MAG: nucleotide exchange factor GrpE [Myxococcota bacterium]|nr:nucleotide exchange factor GrpE [Myxococcota bacterium]
MSESNPPANPEEQPPISVVPDEAGAADMGPDAVAIAKETEGRLRKVSSAYKQLQGEMQAMRERHLRTRDQDQRLMKAQVVKSLFEPLQNLRRSVEAMEKSGVDGDVLSGIQMVGRTFMSAFEEMGLEKVAGVGSRFDPEFHEALSVLPVPQEAADGRIIQVFSEGYRVGETLIQPAKVVIGQYKAPETSNDTPGEE